MFDNQPVNQPLSATTSTSKDNYPQPPQIEDIFSKIDPAASAANVIQPTKPGQLDYRPPMPSPQADYNDVFGNKKFGWKNILVLLIVLLGLLGLIGGGWWVYKFVFSQPAESQINNNQDTPGTGAANSEYLIPAEQESEANIDNNQPNDNQAEVLIPETDSDSDGLSDIREAQLGTDPNQADTDGDGLTDKTEVDIYDTDPLNPDTDSDGYNDGREVANGYDPTRPGEARLYSVPVE